jgi:hypothetical protein
MVCGEMNRRIVKTIRAAKGSRPDGSAKGPGEGESRPLGAGRHHDVPAPDEGAPTGRLAPGPKGEAGAGRSDGAVM